MKRAELLCESEGKADKYSIEVTINEQHTDMKKQFFSTRIILPDLKRRASLAFYINKAKVAVDATLFPGKNHNKQ
jgi:hypothetical protein